ncbi:methyltransferase domain-containing protein [bacterium]|nr:methyltransferase domain-containing protein [bacterium]
MFDPLQFGIDLVERGLVPDFITRAAIRRLCSERARLALNNTAHQETAEFIQSLAGEPLALCPEKANEQHYELPAEFFELMLGPRRKYSCCYFLTPETTLEAAEDEALSLTCQHAELENGHRILELGCGWGSLSLWMAEHYPDSQIVAVSNSQPQRQFIERKATQRALNNLRVITADVNALHPEQTFDRVVSVEMFEHLRNYEQMLQRIASWLNPDGKLFVHHFCHRRIAYPFEVEGPANWMGRYFFTGGLMPTADLLRHFSRDLSVIRQWHWNGMHYQRTADAWLRRLDEHRSEALRILEQTYGPRDVRRWFQRWRIFLLSVSELFGFARGEEWFVTHLLLEPTAVSQQTERTTIEC